MSPTLKNWSIAVIALGVGLVIPLVWGRLQPATSADANGVALQAAEDEFDTALAAADADLAALLDGQRTPLIVPGKYWIGVSCEEPPAVLREQLNLQPLVGVVVVDVEKEGPAAKAGLHRYDILLATVANEQEQPLASSKQLFDAVESSGPVPLVLKLIRRSVLQSITVIPEGRTAATTDADRESPHGADSGQTRLLTPFSANFVNTDDGELQICVQHDIMSHCASPEDLSALPPELQLRVSQFLAELKSQLGRRMADERWRRPEFGTEFLAARNSASKLEVTSRIEEAFWKYRRDYLKYKRELARVQAAEREAAKQLEQSQDVVEKRLYDLKNTLEHLLDQPVSNPLPP